ncbi:NTP transferase domain-containing protein [Kroppenstedtia eburnea]|uniref:NTP transferase domain-containing protein n=1 Tax=Kroppenstedtia eburnea TaxID=714067 RepID=UPI00020C8032|nr:purine catabolism protein PucB [Desmospora sp. 8437]
MSGVIGIYLAAGRSSRMGCDKLRLPLGEMALGSWALTAAVQSRLEQVIVVTGEPHAPAWIAPSLFREPFREKWRSVSCPGAREGQALSLICGLKAAQAGHPEAVMVLLGDQPGVTVDMINRMLRCYERESVSCVASSHRGILQPPVLFSGVWFSDLLQLKGDEGARRLLRDPGTRTSVACTWEDSSAFVDVDTPEQYIGYLGKNGVPIPKPVWMKLSERRQSDDSHAEIP